MGLTARNHRHISLHGNGEPAPEKAGKSKLAPDRATSEDINAPPESSSDESTSKNEDDVHSDDSMPEIRESRRKPPMDSASLKSTSSTLTKGENNGLPPSSIPDSTFFAKHNGSQGSQKRSRQELEAEENDKIDAWSSQPKRPKKMYTHSSQNNGVANVHLSRSMDDSKKVTKKTASPKVKKDERQFRAPDTSWNTSPGRIEVFQVGDRTDFLAAGRRKPNVERKEFRKPSSTESTPQPRRASQRSFRDSQGSQDTPKTFKQPSKSSPKKVTSLKAPIFKTTSVREEAGARRSTRSAALATEPLHPVDSNALATSEIYKSANVAASKLGLSELQLKRPPLSVETISEPSTSFEAGTSSSSPLSSLPEDLATLCGEEKARMITSEDIVIPKPSNQPSCPFCKQPLEKDFLEEHTSINRRLSIRQQAQFCKAHKKRTAEDEWERRQYPKIDWSNFQNYLNSFHNVLDDILQQRTSSFYRNAFEDVVRGRKNKTTKTVREGLLDENRIEELTPGYYGSRGARMMYVAFTQQSCS